MARMSILKKQPAPQLKTYIAKHLNINDIYNDFAKMKLTLAASALLLSVVKADFLRTYTSCGPFGHVCTSSGVWYTDYGGIFDINANDGCHNNPGPTGLERLCIDWANKRLNANFDPLEANIAWGRPTTFLDPYCATASMRR
ncbi:hypothetical protein NLG97_g3056 [Lecanicillium saksenae]|uniref:Uncharacterized protein n=1 Tax=Lecanicillium saksenae TaxID=468837 RepID=A0ACC1R1U3_9HYPO|nr:hypothetical protein NLG97_g3056 [Lecanicillium saksenae]